LIDFDIIKERNLDRTLGATKKDARDNVPKVVLALRMIKRSHTAKKIEVTRFFGSLISQEGLAKALDCDVIISCVDRPWPRHVLNAMTYGHLIPVVDGGILAKLDKGHLIHVDWRIHIIGHGRACLVCLNALKRSDVALDREGKLDDPDYIKGLEESESVLSRRNVFPFSLSVASHEVLQLVGLLTGLQRVGAIGPQSYHAYPGRMDVKEVSLCEPGCEYSELDSKAPDLSPNLI
jgi:hypothetical protein